MNTKDCGIVESRLKIEEASGNVGGFPILAKVTGVHFLPNGFSRNKRFYSEELWRNVLEDENVQTRLKNGTVFGTIGHDIEIDEKALREGVPSHVTKLMEIRENNGVLEGYAETFLIDTPVGKLLNTYLRAGANLYVSSRADGEYSGQTAEGVPMLNPRTFVFERFDFVIDPGFLEANPKLTESLLSGLESGARQKISESLVNDGNFQQIKESKMDPLDKNVKPDGENELSKPQLDTELAESMAVLRTQLTEALGANVALRKKNEDLEGEVARQSAEAQAARDNFDALQKDVSELTGDDVAEGLRPWKKLKEDYGSPSDIDVKITAVDQLEKDVGSLPEVTDAIKRLESFVETYGPLNSVSKSLDYCHEFFSKHGNPKIVERALTHALSFHAKYGEPGTIQEVLEGLATFSKEFGTMESVRESLAASKASRIEESHRQNELVLENRIMDLALRTGIDREKIAVKVREGLQDHQIMEFYRIGGRGRATDPCLFGAPPREISEGKTSKVLEAVGDQGRSAMAPLFGKNTGGAGSRLSRVVGSNPHRT